MRSLGAELRPRERHEVYLPSREEARRRRPDRSPEGVILGSARGRSAHRGEAVTYIGIDPGASGGLAAIDTSGGIVRTAPMPETDADVLSWFVGLSEPRAMLERVSV